MTVIAARTQTTDLVIAPDQTEFNQKQVAVLRTIGVDPNATRPELAMFFHHATRTGLDPFARQIYMIGRKQFENGKEVIRQTIQTGIDGYRLIARRAADAAGDVLAYEPTEWCGLDGQWVDVWVSDQPPRAARVTVVRSGQRYPGIALWAEYAQTKRDGEPTKMWARMPANQLAKCAEAQALRRAFPQDLSGVYVEDEMSSADTGVQSAGRPTRVVSAAAQAINERVAAAPAHEYVEADPDPEVTAEAAASDETEVESPAADVSDTVELVSEKQLKALHAEFSRAKITDRDERLGACSGVLGYDVETTSNLTPAEAQRMIDYLRSGGPS